MNFDGPTLSMSADASKTGATHLQPLAPWATKTLNKVPSGPGMDPTRSAVDGSIPPLVPGIVCQPEYISVNGFGIIAVAAAQPTIPAAQSIATRATAPTRRRGTLGVPMLFSSAMIRMRVATWTFSGQSSAERESVGRSFSRVVSKSLLMEYSRVRRQRKVGRCSSGLR